MTDDPAGPADPERQYRSERGRGAVSNPPGRFDATVTDPTAADDDPDGIDEAALATELAPERVQRVITYNDSPDIPFDRSINPYRGCEHGCIYCYARPTHSYLNLSPGLDFETRLFYKPQAPEQLRRELAQPTYTPAPIALGVNTDAWQPVERRLGLTRRLLAVLAEARHPVTIVTKSALVERDLDWLSELAADGLVSVSVSLTTLDDSLNRCLEPRAAGPRRRLRLVRRLSDAGVPVAALLAPVIPGITDSEMEALLKQAADHGARAAGWIPLRLPHEVAGLFTDWLAEHYPDRQAHVLSLVEQIHGGGTNSGFRQRMGGTGAVADMLSQRFRVARRRAGLSATLPALVTTRFQPPEPPDGQLRLFA
jgi:DNA repair photolyase